MKILFTSDLHGLIPAFNEFSEKLKNEDYQFGVIAGDILDDGISDNDLDEIYQLTELHPDDFLMELPDADESWDETMNKAISNMHNPENPYMKALYYKEQQLKDILNTAQKPIYIIGGNHDSTNWEDDRFVINIHNKRIKIGRYNIVGYRWTRLDRSEEDHIKDIKKLKWKVNRKTILVTHEPAHSILDSLGSENDKIHLGSKEIRRLVDRKKPRFHLFGHVHRAYGRLGNAINGAYPISRDFNTVVLD